MYISARSFRVRIHGIACQGMPIAVDRARPTKVTLRQRRMAFTGHVVNLKISEGLVRPDTPRFFATRVCPCCAQEAVGPRLTSFDVQGHSTPPALALPGPARTDARGIRGPLRVSTPYTTPITSPHFTKAPAPSHTHTQTDQNPTPFAPQTTLHSLTC